MYNLQKILLDNYCNKYNVVISKKEFKNNTWYYYTQMTWDAEFKEFQYSSYLTAEYLFPEYLFPERFNIVEEETGKFNQYSN